MKGKLKYLLFLLMFVAISPSLTAHAETYKAEFNDKYKWIPNVYVSKKESNGRVHYQQLTMIARKGDNQFVYCIEPGTPLDPNETYTGQDYDQSYVANMTPEQWRRIQLLAYYGYGYSDSEVNHDDIKWYSVTQFMIWKTVPHGMDIYFTDTLNGNKITRYTSEMEEMERLVANHQKLPYFGSNSFDMVVGNTLKLTDSNGILSTYAVSDNSLVSTSKSGNDLYITAKGVGDTSLNLTKRDLKYSHPTIVYVKPNTQDLVQVGSYDPVDTTINLHIVGGKIAINKVDYDTGLSEPRGMATLEGAIYGVYLEDGTYVTQMVTDKNGHAQSDYLPSLGRFYVQEISPSKGYELDTNKYYFDLTNENLDPVLPVQEKVIEREYQITIVVATDKTQIMSPEPNVQFGIYDHNNKLIKTLTTDAEGKITFTLPYGKYTLRQLTTPTGFEKIKDFNFEITESGATINKVFSNAEITARIKVVKIDQDGNVITKAGIKFKIKDLSTGKYVCQTVAYPNQKTYCEFETDENGMLITPYPLNSGDYQLEEVDQLIDGYLWNSEPLKFSINENSDIKSTDDFDAIMEIRFINQEVKGKIEIQKTGEQVVIEDGKFTYVEVPLPNITFGLYDVEGNLIDTYITDEQGRIVIENLKLGNYVLKELKTDDKYVLDEKEYNIELKYKDQYTAVVTETFTLKNYLKKGTLDFSKKDLTTGKEIPNVKLEVYTENDELIYSGITDENGKITIEDLFVGKFYIVETEPATGYKLSDEKVYFEVKENGEIVKAEMTNEKITGSLEFTKEDLSTGEALPNTLIEVYNAETDELVFSGRTDENGKIIIENLEYGKYYILEKEAPEGYKLNPDRMYFEILEDGQVIKSVMKDEIVDVPNTGINDYHIIDIIGLAFIIGGIGFLIYEKTKKK